LRLPRKAGLGQIKRAVSAFSFRALALSVGDLVGCMGALGLPGFGGLSRRTGRWTYLYRLLVDIVVERGKEIVVREQGEATYLVPCAWPSDTAIAYVPSTTDWTSETPDWLRNRRDEVVGLLRDRGVKVVAAHPRAGLVVPVVPRRNRRAIAVGVVVAVALVAAALVFWLPTSQTRVVPISIAFGGQIPLVQVRVVGGQTLTVALDTGSVGLRLVASRLHSQAGISDLGGSDQATFADGTTFSGHRAEAQFQFAGFTTPTSTWIQIADRVSCGSGNPRCFWAHLPTGSEIDGLLGIAPYLFDPAGVANPLGSYPAHYGEHYSVSFDAAHQKGQLILGASSPGDPIATLRLAESQAYAGKVGWDPFPRLCWRISGAPRWCVPTIFDTGSSFSALEGYPFKPSTRQGIDDPVVGRLVSGGLPVDGYLPGRDQPFLRIYTGAGPSQFGLLPGDPTMSLGLGSLAGYTVNFDTDTGVMTLAHYDR
jgi:hypothetical protein